MNKKNFTKKDIASKVSKQTGLSFLYSKKIVDDIILILSQNIKKNSLNIMNFGTFKINYNKERIGRNPKTKEEYVIGARNIITFKVSKNILKEFKIYD